MTDIVIDSFEKLASEQQKTLASLRNGLCGCWACLEERGEIRVHMILCPECGNNRCPKASDHRLACTGSNASGQPGSVYE